MIETVKSYKVEGVQYSTLELAKKAEKDSIINNLEVLWSGCTNEYGISEEDIYEHRKPIMNILKESEESDEKPYQNKDVKEFYRWMHNTLCVSEGDHTEKTIKEVKNKFKEYFKDYALY